MEKAERFESLDAIRGIAALSVLLCHYCYGYYVLFDVSENGISAARTFGLAVQLFFMLSGFVIFYSVNSNTLVFTFLKKRFIRLYPTFWICLLISYASIKIFGLPGLEVTGKEAFFNITMLPQFFGALKVDSCYWTLVPEFFFYLMMGGLIYFKLLDKMVIVSLVWLFLSFIHLHVYHIKVLGLLLNLDYASYFLAGIMVYELKRDKKQKIFWVILFITVVLGLSKYLDSIGNLMVLTALYLFFISLIFSDLKFLENRVLLFLGKISFPLYLLHQNIGFIIINYTKDYFDYMWVIVPPIIICILLATLVTFYIEKPIIKYLKKKWL